MTHQTISPVREEGRSHRQVRHVYSKSLPRSGHHFLTRMLKRYFGSELRYCEFYQPKDCCHLIPCSRAYDPEINNKYFIQKSHDLHFEDNKNLPGLFLLQYRGIITQIQSHFDFVLGVGRKDWEDTMEGFKIFAESRLDYYIHFYDKWITNKPDNSLIITYEGLSKNTEDELQKILSFITGEHEIDKDRLELALLDADVKINTVNSPQTIRDPCNFRHFDLGYYQELEQRVYDTCPSYEPVFRFI